MVLDILNALPFSIYWIQPSTNIFRGCNKNFLISHHYNDINKVIDKSIHTIFSEKQCEVLNTLLKKKYENTEKNSNIYFELIDTSQRPLFIQCSKIPFVEDLVVFSETFIDIQTLNQSLWKEKENLNIYLNNIVEYIPASIYWKDRNYTILGCSQLHAELAGYSDRREVVGKNDYDFVWKSQAKSIIKNDQFVMDKNETVFFEEEAVLRDGSLHTFLTRKSPLKGKLGETIGVLGVSIDITELKETQSALIIALNKAEAANQAKTEFLENMRHDIRTPLSGIVGCAQLIQMQADDPKKVAEYADDLIQSSDALLEFLNKILESIQVASGEIPLLKKKFNLYHALEQVVHLNKPQASIKKLSLHFDYDKTIPAYLMGDPVRVQRILLELVTNALKFTDKGEIKIMARLMKNKTHLDQKIIQLSVSDTGIGIPLDKQHEVYTRFKRLMPSYQGIYPGTGLGLSLVKQFIDDLGGELHLKSKPNQGSKFTCIIPFQESLLTTDENGLDTIQLEETFDTGLSQRSINVSSVSQETLVATGSLVLVVEDNAIAAKVAQGRYVKTELSN